VKVGNNVGTVIEQKQLQ